jgi:putative transcriptional regulator
MVTTKELRNSKRCVSPVKTAELEIAAAPVMRSWPNIPTVGHWALLARIFRRVQSLRSSPYCFVFDKTIALTQYYVVANNGSHPALPGESGLYNRIAQLRAERDISRQELADAVGVNYQTIGFLERGNYGPSLKLAFVIAAYFGLPIEAIFSTEPLKSLSEQVYGGSRSPEKE